VGGGFQMKMVVAMIENQRLEQAQLDLVAQ
jgi:hypothetical protein